jgi:hypothetical protein
VRIKNRATLSAFDVTPFVALPFYAYDRVPFAGSSEISTGRMRLSDSIVKGFDAFFWTGFMTLRWHPRPPRNPLDSIEPSRLPQGHPPARLYNAPTLSGWAEDGERYFARLNVHGDSTASVRTADQVRVMPLNSAWKILTTSSRIQVVQRRIEEPMAVLGKESRWLNVITVDGAVYPVD